MHSTQFVGWRIYVQPCPNLGLNARARVQPNPTITLRLSNNIRTVEKTSHRSVSSLVFFIWIKDVSRIKLIRLRVNRDFILKRKWWSYQINNLFSQNVILRRMQSWDLRQRIVSNYSLFWAMTSRVTINRKTH